MAIFFKTADRRVIPNWRDYKRTVLLGELNSTSQKKNQFRVDISRQIADWKIENSMGTAADLLSSAYLSDDRANEELYNASNFILTNSDLASRPLIDLAKEIIEPAESKINPIDSKNVNDILEVNSEQTFQLISRLIKGLKQNLISNPQNSIWWVDLARLYSILGQMRQAQHAMKIAINLAPDNRFVLRSATRLFIHNDEPDLALHYLRKSNRTKFDPWLLSAHIATSAVLEKFQVNASIAKEMALSKNFSNFDITELSSSLGTLELGNGSFKNSKKFFDISRLALNDNSLAQLEWVSRNDARFSLEPSLFQNVSNSYEALAIEKFENGHWVPAVNNCIRWLYDMPYSSRPVILGSYICSAFLKDHETAIKICNLGLIASPNDPTILNNLIYAFCLANKIDEANEAAKNLHIYKLQDLSHEATIMLQATAGLLAFRSKKVEEGIELYKVAVKNSQIAKREDLELLANINFLRELILAKRPEVEGVYFAISNISDEDIDKHLKSQKKEILDLYVSSRR